MHLQLSAIGLEPHLSKWVKAEPVQRQPTAVVWTQELTTLCNPGLPQKASLGNMSGSAWGKLVTSIWACVCCARVRT